MARSRMPSAGGRGACGDVLVFAEGGPMEMRRRAVAMVIMAMLTAAALGGCAGCSAFGPPSDDELAQMAGKYADGALMDEEQARIARDMGADEETVEKMATEGMTYLQWERVSYAQAMLAHLEGKYGMAFTARRLQMPSWGHSAYTLVAEVAEGEHAGTEFTCDYVYPCDGGRCYFEDDLYVKAMGDAYQEYLYGLALDVYGGRGSGLILSAKMISGDLGDGMTLDTPVAEVAPYIDGKVEIYFPPDTALTEDEYYQLANTLMENLREAGVSCTCEFFAITHVPEGYVDWEQSFSLWWAESMVDAGDAQNRDDNDYYHWRIFEDGAPQKREQHS